jgi:hypothetical protein
MCADNNPLLPVPACRIRLGWVSVNAGTNEKPPELNSALAYCALRLEHIKKITATEKKYFMNTTLLANVTFYSQQSENNFTKGRPKLLTRKADSSELSTFD